MVNSEGQKRTRAWESLEGSSTIVQFRTDTYPYLWMNTNLGWVPVNAEENKDKTLEEVEKQAEQIAESYGLVESSPERAAWLAGWDDSEEIEDRIL